MELARSGKRKRPSGDRGLGFYQVVRYVGFSLGSALAASILAGVGGHHGQPAQVGYTTVFWVAAAICVAAAGIAWVLTDGAPATAGKAREVPPNEGAKSGCGDELNAKDLQDQPGHIRAHQRAICPEVLRTPEISAAGQAACQMHPARSNTREHKTRPTRRLNPLGRGRLYGMSHRRRHVR